MTSNTQTSPSNPETIQAQESLSAAEPQPATVDQNRRPAAKGKSATQASFLKRSLFKLAGLVRFVLKRQWNHPGLTLLALLGVVLAVGLVTSATFFSDAVERVILDKKLAEFSQITGRPPFSTNVYTFPSTRQPMSLENAEEVASHVADTLSSEVGLPLKHLGVQVSSGGMMLRPKEGSSLYGDELPFLGSVDLVYASGIEENIETVAGEPLDDGVSHEVLDVWMHNRLAEEMGVNVGDEFQVGVMRSGAGIPLRVKGFWQARDRTDPFWFSNPDEALKDAFLVRRQDYASYVQRLIPSGTRQVSWHIILDDSKVTPANARDYIYGFERGMAVINKYLPGAQLNAPPLDPLEEFVQRETTLGTLLLGFNLPAYGFLLYFLVLTSAIIARWQRRDTAILVSRGTTTSGVLGLTLIDELLLFIVGIPLGIGFGMLLARLMGYTSSFLSLASRSPLPVTLAGINLFLLLAALAVALIARLWPAVQAARQSVVEFEREQARPIRAPFWYRYYLDLLLLLATYYAYRQLTNVGSLALLVEDQPEDLYRDPLLILVPALFILTAALLTLRVFPLVMRIIDRFAGGVPWTTPYLALRRLGRQSQGYINPLLLMIVSLGLGVYTISMAASLDQWLVDRMYYRVGTDLTFEPAPLVEGEDLDLIDGAWIPLPGEFRKLPGVTAATRLGDYSMVIDLAGRDEIRGRFLAIDRSDFASVAWFRRDFAADSLGGLMNRLALASDGILVSEQFMEENHVQIGDQIHLRVGVSNLLTIPSSFTVVGTYKYFPTVYEEERMAVIGNLEYLSTLLGVALPHYIWLRTQDSIDGQAVLKAVPGTMGISVSSLRQSNTRALIEEEKAKTERVGVFGTLSVGFVAAVVMAAVGLMIYSYAALQERLYRFAVLRAMGLRRRQIVGQVVLEYAFLTALGAVAGALIGKAAAELFVPFFRVSGERIPLPPLLPIVAEQDISELVVFFAGIMILLELLVIARALSWRYFGALRGRGE
jgi:putative ABC transport system permease protein